MSTVVLGRKRKSPTFVKQTYKLLKKPKHHIRPAIAVGTVANILRRYQEVLAEPVDDALQPYLNNSGADSEGAMEEDVRAIANVALREQIQIFLFVVKGNMLPLPMIDMTEDGAVVAMWTKGPEGLNIFFDDEGVTTHWCCVEGTNPPLESQQYGVDDEKDEEFLRYLKFKLKAMGLS